MVAKNKSRRKRTDDTSTVPEVCAIVIEGLAAEHEHADDMGIYNHTGRDVNGRGVWALVGHREAFLFYSELGSWCVSDAEDMEAGQHQGSLMVESDAVMPYEITEPWSVHDSENWAADAPSVRVRGCSSVEVDAALLSVEQGRREAVEAAQRVRR